MAWIETGTDTVVNLDAVEYLSIEWNDGEMSLWANTDSVGHPIYTEESTGGKEQSELFHRLMVQIAQIARGNAYISQDDIGRMMEEARKSAEQ